MGLLSLAIWMPIAFGVLLLAMGRDENAGVVRWVALVGAVASFLVTLPLITGFDTQARRRCSSSRSCPGSSASTCTTTWAWTACRCGSCC
jgi:NADH:ubiquinone oxidoreductase subunit 4 (subunit M)